MSAALLMAAAYLVYVVLGALAIYVLIARALRAAEQAAAADLDRELRDLVAQGAKRDERAPHSQT